MVDIRLNLFLILSSLFITSCTITGLTDGYSNLSPEQREKVGYSSKGDTIDKKILMVNGKELRDRFDSNKTNVVFIYNPNCNSKMCVKPSFVLNNLPDDCKLYVVPTIITPTAILESDSYDTYGIDKYYYGSNYVFKYEDKFISDLIDEKYELDENDLFIFKGKKYIKKTRAIDPVL